MKYVNLYYDMVIIKTAGRQAVGHHVPVVKCKESALFLDVFGIVILADIRALCPGRLYCTVVNGVWRVAGDILIFKIVFLRLQW